MFERRLLANEFSLRNLRKQDKKAYQMVKLSRNVTNLAAIRNSIFLIKETDKHEKHIINFDHTWVNGKKIDEFI